MGVKLRLSAELAAPGRASSALECPRPSGDTADTFGLRASPNVRQARSPIAGRGSGAASPRFPARCEGSSESNARPAAWGCRGSGRRCGRRNTVPSERIPWTLPPAPTRMRARAVQRANRPRSGREEPAGCVRGCDSQLLRRRRERHALSRPIAGSAVTIITRRCGEDASQAVTTVL